MEGKVGGPGGDVLDGGEDLFPEGPRAGCRGAGGQEWVLQQKSLKPTERMQWLWWPSLSRGSGG